MRESPCHTCLQRTAQSLFCTRHLPHRDSLLQGNIVLSYFMQLWGDQWVQKYVKHMVAVSGPWGGAVTSLKAAVSGDNFGLYFSHDLLHSVQGTSPSGPWLFPSTQVWNESDVLVSTDKRNYSAYEFDALLQVRAAGVSVGQCLALCTLHFQPRHVRVLGFWLGPIAGMSVHTLLRHCHCLAAWLLASSVRIPCKDVQDSGLERLAALYPRLRRLHDGQLAAGYVPVPMTCIHGNGVDTDQAYHYDVDALNASTAPEPKATVTKEGDGTVNLQSLKVCCW